MTARDRSHQPSEKCAVSVSAGAIAIQNDTGTPIYFFGVDPAHGQDRSAWAVFERCEDGRLRYIDAGEGDLPENWGEMLPCPPAAASAPNHPMRRWPKPPAGRFHTVKTIR